MNPQVRGRSLTQLFEGAQDVLSRLKSIAEEHPDWIVKRNAVGNVALIDPSGEYRGYVDFLNGEVDVF